MRNLPLLAATILVLFVDNAGGAQQAGARQQAKEIPIEIQLLEARGMLDSARSQFSRAPAAATAQGKEHLELLVRVDTLLSASRFYADSGLVDLAHRALDGLVVKGDGTAGLALAVEAWRDSLAARPNPRAEATGRSAIRTAVSLADSGAIDVAIARLNAIVADTTGGGFPLSVRTSAARASANLQERKARQDADLVKTTVREARKTWAALSGLIVYIGVVAGIALLLFLIRLIIGPRKGVAVEVDDLTVEADKRNDARGPLVLEISRQLRSVARAGDSTLGNKAEDVDGVANLRSQAPLSDQVEKLVANGTLNLGVVSLDPKQIISIMAVVGKRPTVTTLRGYLASEGNDDVVLFVERFDQRLRWNGWSSCPQPNFYRTRGAGACGRADAVRDFAVQYVFDHTPQKPTGDLDSFREYCRGLRALEEAPDGAAASLDAAGVAFERAVGYDPLNWAAQFKLAEVLRKKGNYASAKFHFEELLALCQAPLARRPSSLRSYLHSNPEFPYIVEYNLGLTKSMGLDTASHEEALKCFDELLQRLEPVR